MVKIVEKKDEKLEKSRLGALNRSIDTNNNGVISLIRLQSELLLWLQLLRLKFLHLGGEHGFWRGSGVDAASL